MTAGIEQDAAEQWICMTLSGDAQLQGLGVYSAVAPEGAGFPHIVFQAMGGHDVMIVGATRIFAQLLYLVKVVGKTATYASLATAAARVDQLLHRGSGATSDGETWGCYREQPFRLAEVSNGIQYRSSGGLYRLYVT